MGTRQSFGVGCRSLVVKKAAATHTKEDQVYGHRAHEAPRVRMGVHVAEGRQRQDADPRPAEGRDDAADHEEEGDDVAHGGRSVEGGRWGRSPRGCFC